MADPVFTRTYPNLLSVLEEIRQREPIFHTEEFGTTADEFARMMEADYWEVGVRASLQPGVHPALPRKGCAGGSFQGWMVVLRLPASTPGPDASVHVHAQAEPAPHAARDDLAPYG